MAGEDYDWFPLPPIDQEGILYAGEYAVIGTNGNRPEVRDFLDAVRGRADPVRTGRRSGLVEDLGEHQRRARTATRTRSWPTLSAVLVEAIANDTGRFDASDLMPGEVGAGSFWTGMVEYMQEGPDSLQDVLDEIEGELARVTDSTPGEG